MLDKKLLDILAHEGVVAIVSCCENEPHVVNTWHSYVNIPEDDRLLIPAGGMTSIEKDTSVNNTVLLALGSNQVEGSGGSMGAGFRLEGTARFLTSGPDFEKMVAQFPWLSRVLEVTVTSLKETM